MGGQTPARGGGIHTGAQAAGGDRAQAARRMALRAGCWKASWLRDAVLGVEEVKSTDASAPSACEEGSLWGRAGSCTSGPITSGMYGGNGSHDSDLEGEFPMGGGSKQSQSAVLCCSQRPPCDLTVFSVCAHVWVEGVRDMMHMCVCDCVRTYIPVLSVTATF